MTKLKTYPRKFSIESEPAAPGLWRVKIGGELDVYSSPRLRQEIRRRLEEGSDVEVDFSDVEHVDCSGLGALMSGMSCATRQSRKLTVVGIQPAVARIFVITKLDRVFDLDLN